MNEQPKTQTLAVRDYHDIISKVAAVKDLDVGKLRELMTMQEDLEKRQAAIHYNEMMALAQGEMTQISKDSSNPQTRSRYASLEALDEAIRPIYTKYGFSIEFDELHAGERENGVLLAIYVSCGAETRRRTKYIPVTTVGIRGVQAMTPTHASVGAVTYGRRTLLKMVFNLAEADTDGDFEKFDKIEHEVAERTENPAPPEEPKQTDIEAIIKEMRNKKDHSGLYSYKEGFIKTIWPKIFPGDRQRLEDEYKALMAKFAEQQK